ncbi:hypothetical protein [Nostoc sp. TCL26-01]|uniref:hypothetical protein n=1 Tax=Nostoc sp. TCL26-01 TaxID=2576904 RepID=UPI0015C0A63A|nr:hypothetical protein [Nostoc sp. TCL26-01]QLE58783.1 hypothetical protein FD725_26740 [Nostoc sp. TCL26-01]
MIHSNALTTANAALIIAHPGHEIRVHGWLELACPMVFILTDGSGSSQEPRLNSTTKILNKINAKPSNIYGRFSDREIYQAILNHDFNLFIKLTEELVDILSQAQVELVVGDAVEGYNPVHDVCRIIINAAVEILEKRGQKIANFDFWLNRKPDDFAPQLSEQVVCLKLDDAGLARKLATAQGYDEMAEEVNAAIQVFGLEVFRNECFRQIQIRGKNDAQMADTPFYEQYGEKKVVAGLYQQVLRYDEHVYPLAQALWNYIEGLI